MHDKKLSARLNSTAAIFTMSSRVLQDVRTPNNVYALS